MLTLLAHTRRRFYYAKSKDTAHCGGRGDGRTRCGTQLHQGVPAAVGRLDHTAVHAADRAVFDPARREGRTGGIVRLRADPVRTGRHGRAVWLGADTGYADCVHRVGLYRRIFCAGTGWTVPQKRFGGMDRRHRAGSRTAVRDALPERRRDLAECGRVVDGIFHGEYLPLQLPVQRQLYATRADLHRDRCGRVIKSAGDKTVPRAGSERVALPRKTRESLSRSIGQPAMAVLFYILFNKKSFAESINSPKDPNHKNQPIFLLNGTKNTT